MRPAVAVIALSLGLPITAQPVSAAESCPLPDEAGRWVNQDARKRGDVSIIEISHDCAADGSDQWRIRARALCQPRNCTWGFSGGRRSENGALVALFRTFAAERWVVMRVAGTQMNVRLLHDFRDARRADERQAAVLTRDGE